MWMMVSTLPPSTRLRMASIEFRESNSPVDRISLWIWILERTNHFPHDSLGPPMPSTGPSIRFSTAHHQSPAFPTIQAASGVFWLIKEQQLVTNLLGPSLFRESLTSRETLG